MPDLIDAIEAEVPYIITSERAIRFSADAAQQDFSVEPRRVTVYNARRAPEPLSLDVQGFVIARHPSRVVAERIDELIEENSRPSERAGPASLAYLVETAPLIRAVTGAREVIAQDGFLTMRFSARSAVQAWMSTAVMAHLDFAPSEVQRQLDRSLQQHGMSVDPFSRMKVIQTWRVTTPPPQDRPLAICDARSVPATGSVEMEYVGPEGSFNASVKSRGCRFDPAHRWFYFPDMDADELLIFKGYDSADPQGMSALHTAIDDRTRADAVPRGSIECRFFALFD